MDLMRNVQSRFSKVPQANIGRSRIDSNHSYKSSGVFGKLIPFYCEEVLPGQTKTLDMSMVLRLQPSVVPVLDDAYLDTFFFYVPNRLTWEHWKSFIGDDSPNAWTDPVEYSLPQVSVNAALPHNHLCSYMGLPIGVSNYQASIALPLRGYGLIWNRYFRDQNTMDPVYVPLDDANMNVYSDPAFDWNHYVTSWYQSGMCLPVSKYHDYFTSLLPSAQKGSSVALPIGGLAPIVAETLTRLNALGDPLQMSFSELAQGNGNIGIAAGTAYMTSGSVSVTNPITHTNLYADLENATGATINDFRYALKMQEYQELLARGGSRYTEVLNTMFGVTVPDLTAQEPEYLGGKRMRLNMSQVVQTSATASGSENIDVLGQVAGLSITSQSGHVFSKSFVEHGWIIGVCCARTRHTYSQGLSKKFQRKDKFDFYWPQFAKIGEQPVLRKTLFLTGSGSAADNEVLGFQEAWAEYRYYENKVTGLLAPNANDSLSVWTYADDFAAAPTLSGAFLAETPENVERSLAIQGTDQFFFDMLFNEINVSPIPLYSTPSIMSRF